MPVINSKKGCEISEAKYLAKIALNPAEIIIKAPVRYSGFFSLLKNIKYLIL